MRSESMMFEGKQGIKLFLDSDIYALKEKAETPQKEPIIVSESLFVETPSISTSKATAKLLVLVENAEKTNKSAKETEFITKLVNAVGIHMKDVQIRSFTDSDTVEAKKAILFYTSTEKTRELSIFESYNQELKKYEPFNVYNQHFLWADNLEAITETVDLKKALWAGLKAMFGLS